jgi:hypothetical protein
MERALGALINAMNPYSNPACEHIERVAGRMHPLGGRPLPEGRTPENATIAELLSQIDVEIDNYQGEWSFMGQIYKIKRALLIPYRYEVRNNHGQGSGVMAINNILVGYTGGNGGG